MYSRTKMALPIVIFITIILLVSACSKGGTPVVTDDSLMNQSDSIHATSDRTVIAVYDAVLDPESQTIALTPDERSVSAHQPLSQGWPYVLSIMGYGNTPMFYADIKLTHPYPGVGISVYDPRVIAIVPANSGVSFNYPIAGMNANHFAILEPDGYTKLFDNLDPSIPGTANPFKAYFKSTPNRVWSGTGVTSETQRWYMSLSGFGGPLKFKLVVDVSTNYPSPPQPVVDNAPEPVEIKTVVGTGLTPSGGSAPVEVTILDWQGRTGVGGVVCECPSLFNGVVMLSYSRPGTNPNEYVYSGTITNGKHAAAGQYGMLIGTWDSATMIAIADEVMVTVGGVTLGVPTVITPQWMNFSPFDVVISGNYAYVAGERNGLHIFNIQNPLKPVWVKSVPHNGYVEKLAYADGYVYFCDSDIGLFVVDVSPINTAHVVRTINMDSADNLCLSGSYLYICNGWNLDIVDISNPESAYVVKTVVNIEGPQGIEVANGYAFIGTSDYFTVVDIDPPSTAAVVKTLDTPGAIYDLKYKDGYLFCAANMAGMVILNVSNPLSPSILTSVSTYGYAERIHLANGYAYIGSYYIEIVDIEPVTSSYMVNKVTIPGEASGCFYANGYLFATGPASGLHTLDVDPPESAFIASTVGTTNTASDVAVMGDYLYVGATNGGLQVYNVSHPETANFVKLLPVSTGAMNLDISQGYVYLAEGSYKFDIVDVDPIDSMYIAKSIDTYSNATDFEYHDGYVYASIYGYGLNIFDVDPVDTAYKAKEIYTSSTTYGAAYWNGYAILSGSYSDMLIFDVDPVDSASQIKNVAMLGNGSDVDAADGYAVVADGSYIRIVDIDPPESAYIVTSVSTYGAKSVDIMSGYALVGGFNDLRIVDIDPPVSAYITCTMNLGAGVDKVTIDGRYAYLCLSYKGLGILKLW